MEGMRDPGLTRTGLTGDAVQNFQWSFEETREQRQYIINVQGRGHGGYTVTL